MDRELKACACFQAGHAARHNRHDSWTMALRAFGIRDGIATYSKLLKRRLAVPSGREQQNVPVVVSHVEQFEIDNTTQLSSVYQRSNSDTEHPR